MVYNDNHKLLISQKNILEYLLKLDEWNSVLDKPISDWLPFKNLNSDSKLIQCKGDSPTLEGNNL